MEKELKLNTDGAAVKLTVPQFINVTRSFSQKVNLANHVEDHDYEGVDFFSSYGSQVPVEEATPEKLAAVSEELYQKAKTEVETSINNYIANLKAASGDQSVPTAAEILAIAPFIKELAENGKEKFDEITAKIAEAKDKLSDTQINMLRQIALHVKNS